MYSHLTPATGVSLNTLPGIEFQRTGSELAAVLALAQADFQAGRFPADFPLQQWQEQLIRYQYYWSWATGGLLEEQVGKTKDDRPVYRYPLRINPVRNFARKHAALLFGEVPDTPQPLIKMVVKPKTIFGEATEKQKDNANFCAALINEVWKSSAGGSSQYENGTISQWLGGSVFQVSYVPQRGDLLIPITVRNLAPDFFLPVWDPDDYYNLIEAWVVYAVEPRVANALWKIEPQKGMNRVLYVGHYTRTTTQIFADGEAIEGTYPNGQSFSYKEPQPNPFGKVPFYYTPRLREGNFYGSSLVPDVAGLATEFNSRAADEGDAMRRTAQQRFTGSNITGEPRIRKVLDKDGKTVMEFIDVGVTNPALDDAPDLSPLEPPDWKESYSRHKDFLWQQLGREGGMGPIAFGEDEGSQRSALTLAFRMWPSTVSARAQRIHWNDAQIHIGQMILNIAYQKRMLVGSKTVPQDHARAYDLGTDWLPMIPRDREAQVNEIILRLQTNAISLEKALEDFGDVPDVKVEVERIKKWLEFMADTQAQQQPAQQDLSTPVASTNLKE